MVLLVFGVERGRGSSWAAVMLNLHCACDIEYTIYAVLLFCRVFVCVCRCNLPPCTVCLAAIPCCNNRMVCWLLLLVALTETL